MPRPLGAVTLDHVAHAVHHWQDVWGRYATDLGAEWTSGGGGVGFAPGQVRFANGARVELLMPHDTHRNDFLERFLRSSGPGAHHLTFKVDDIDATIERARQAGWEPIGIDLSDPDWMEAFLHPKQATGVVVQLAQAAGGGWTNPAPDGFPVERRQRADRSGSIDPASLRRVTHAVADLALARSLFVDLLGGQTVGAGADDALAWVDLAWDGPLQLRLVAPNGHAGGGALSGWLGGRVGRVHHLGLVAEEPAGIPDARPIRADDAVATLDLQSAGAWIVEPEANQGLRLVVVERLDA